MLYAWKLTFHVFVEGSKINVVYRYQNFSWVHTLCGWLLRHVRIHGLTETLVDTVGTPGGYNREKFRMHLWSYFTNAQNKWLTDRCPDQECMQYWFLIQVWWSFSDVNAFSSSCASGKGYNPVSNQSCSSLPSAEGYHALSCAKWIARAHLAHFNQNDPG